MKDKTLKEPMDKAEIPFTAYSFSGKKLLL